MTERHTAQNRQMDMQFNTGISVYSTNHPHYILYMCLCFSYCVLVTICDYVLVRVGYSYYTLDYRRIW